MTDDRYIEPTFEEPEDTGSRGRSLGRDGSIGPREEFDFEAPPPPESGSRSRSFSRNPGAAADIPGVASASQVSSYKPDVPPSNVDLSDAIVDTLNRLQNAESPMFWQGILRQSAQDIVQIPEITGFLVDYYRVAAGLDEHPEDPNFEGNPIDAAIQFGTPQSAIAALYERIESKGWEDVHSSAEKYPNVAVLKTEYGPNLSAASNDVMLGILGGVPGTNLKSAPPQAMFGSLLSQITNPSRDIRNYREELAAQAAVRLREQPPANPRQEKEFLLWLFMEAENKTEQSKGRQSHLGGLGAGLDMPTNIIRNTLNEALDQIVFPNDELNRSSLSWGYNVGNWWGFDESDAPGSSVMNHPALKVITKPLQYSLNTIPVVAGVSVHRKLSGSDEGIVQTPIIGDVIEQLEQANTFELVSGANDFASWVWMDPLTYAAGAGFGVKALDTTFMPANVSRGVHVMKSVVPFYGAHYSGVRTGMTSRFVASVMMKSWDDTIDVLRTTPRGTEVFDLLKNSDSVAQVGRRVPALKDNPAVPILMDAAKREDANYVWEMLRGMGPGANNIDPGNAYDVLRGMAAAYDKGTHRAARRALDEGRLNLRSVMFGMFGSQTTDDVFEIAAVAGGKIADEASFYDETTLVNIQAPAGIAAETGNLVKSGDNVEVYAKIVDGVESFGVKVDGEIVGGATYRIGVDGGSVGLSTTGRNTIAGDLLADAMGPVGLETLAKDPTISPAGLRWLHKQAKRLNLDLDLPEMPVEVLRLSAVESAGDGARRAIVNHKMGWEVLDGQDKNLIKWLENAGESRLARKLSLVDTGRAGDRMSILALTDDELRKLQAFVDNVSDADAIKFGDNMIVGRSSQGKLLYGADIDEIVDVSKVIPDAAEKSLAANFSRQAFDGRHRELTLINRMPTVSSRSMFAENVAKWSGWNSSTRVARFARQTKGAIKWTPPTQYNFKNPREGAQDLRRTMDLLGVSPSLSDEVMDAWWRAPGVEARRDVLKDAFVRMGRDIRNPKMELDMGVWPSRHGAASYHKGPDGAEVGAATRADGHETVVPILRSMYQDSMPAPDIMGLRREAARFRKGQHLPTRVLEGFGKTKENRKRLIAAYKQNLTEREGPKSWAALGATEKARENMAMTIAYSDVLGYRGRTNGLPLANRMFSTVAKPYKFFHNTFTIAQLAFRPVPWLSRVGLEEHARAWMMGLPTVVRFPVQYGMSFWDKHLIQSVPRQIARQTEAANKSATLLFGPKTNIADSLTQADEILPGWSAKVKARGIDMNSAYSLRVNWSHDLAESLIRDVDISANSKAGISNTVLRRQSSITARTDTLEARYAIDPKEWNFKNDVPEMVNKSNVWMIADEMQSSIKDVDFVENLKPNDINIYADSAAKKIHQVVNDQAGHFALRRMLARMRGEAPAETPEVFVKTGYWRDVRENIEDVARFRGLGEMSETQLAEFYLDTLISDEIISTSMRGFWRNDPTEKMRIVGDLAARRNLTVNVDSVPFEVSLRKDKYASGKEAWRELFHAEHAAGNFDFPTVSGIFHPLYANPDEMGWFARNNPFRRWTNWMLQTFGEDVSQQLHRRPAYLAERRRNMRLLENIGMSRDEAARVAHVKAFEMVNYTFFNNQHTGILLNQMNKVVPFVSAWAEVASTWAWKIPSQNFLPLGYARMLHRMDQVMQGFVKLGLVDIDDSGQWFLNLETDSSAVTPVGRGVSEGMLNAMQAPITTIEHTANIARLLKSTFSEDEYDPVDFSAWKKDDYQIAIGSPVKPNSHGVMGVNQFQFGLNPVASFMSNEAFKRIPFAGDTELIEGNTLADMYDQLSPDIGVGEFLNLNEEAIRAKIGDESFELLYVTGGQGLDPADVNLDGVSLQVPGSSWMDGMVEDIFYPFGAVETPMGMLREIVPSTVSYMVRGFGLWQDEGLFAEGIVPILTGPMEEYQIAGEQAKALLHLEASEGLISRARDLAVRLETIYREAGYGSVEEFKRNVPAGEEASIAYSETARRLEVLNGQIMKRSTDNAAFSIFARGLMGWLSPATPRMAQQEQQITGQWWIGREMAEASRVRGSLAWSEALAGDTKINTPEEFDRFMRIVDGWLEDDTGDYVKAWFRETYPSLAVWTQGSTYYDPEGEPPMVRDLDSSMDAIERGVRVPYDWDVLMQRNARAAVDGSYESALAVLSGTRDQEEQALWALNNWGEYSSIRDERRMKIKALDVWDENLNGGAYMEWAERNDSDLLFERYEEDMFTLEEAADRMLALADGTNIFDPDERRTYEAKFGAVMRQYQSALSEVMEARGEEGKDWQNNRDVLIDQYFVNVVAPYYDARGERFVALSEAESAFERSVIYEELRDLENEHYAEAHTVKVGGENVPVPSELERAWLTLEPEEQENKILSWMGRPPEWLSSFALSRIVGRSPAAAEFLPIGQESQAVFRVATEQKKAYREEAMRDARITDYELGQRYAKVDTWLRDELSVRGLGAQAQWLDAWPIERLMLTGMLPDSLRQVGEWYLGIKQYLQANDPPKGPTSTLGQRYFKSLTDRLEFEYWLANPQAKEDFDSLGLGMFDEGGRYAVYARMYGDTIGEVE